MYVEISGISNVRLDYCSVIVMMVFCHQEFTISALN